MTTDARPAVILAGALAQRPGQAGHAWVFLNWAQGLRALGYDVVFLDRLPAAMGSAGPAGESREWAWLKTVMHGAGFAGRFALLLDDGEVLGMDREALLAHARRAELLFNVMGYLDDDEILDAVDLRVFVDVDPGFPQMWHALGLADPFAGHDAFVTVGLAVGSPASTVPTCGRRWIPTPPPIDLGSWPAVRSRRVGETRMTTVATWRGPFGPIEYEGTTYGLRVHEHRAYAQLPRRVPQIQCELALAIDEADETDAALLRVGGWRLVAPDKVTPTPAHYRRYVQGSDGELAVAKGMYVQTRGGWFSDRSACYLASGCPVIAQDTGYSAHLPTGAGLLAFSTPDEAAECATEIDRDLPRHARAARELALEFLDAPKVLTSVINRLPAA